MTHPRYNYQLVEAGDRDSFEAVRIFEQQFADARWVRAVADRFDGLTLYEQIGDKLNPRAVHFQHCPAGFDGNGPKSTMRILSRAGFGEETDLWDTVSKVKCVTLAR